MEELDDLILDLQKVLGQDFDQPYIESIKKTYGNDRSAFFNDMIGLIDKETGVYFDAPGRIKLKRHYNIPLSFSDKLALSESRGSGLETSTTSSESSATGPYQITKTYHEKSVKDKFGVGWDDFSKDPKLQDKYMLELEKDYDKYLDRYKNYPIAKNKNLSDDQIKMAVHVLGPSGAQIYLQTGNFTGDQKLVERKKRDIEQALTFFSEGVQAYDQTNFSKPETNGDKVKSEDRFSTTTIDWKTGQIDYQPRVPSDVAPKTKKPHNAGTYNWSTPGDTRTDAGVTTHPKSIESSIATISSAKQQLAEMDARKMNKFSAQNIYDPTPTAEGINWELGEVDSKTDVPVIPTYKDTLGAREEVTQFVKLNTDILEHSKVLLQNDFGKNWEDNITSLYQNLNMMNPQIEGLSLKLKEKYGEATMPELSGRAEIAKQAAVIRDEFDKTLNQYKSYNSRIEYFNNQISLLNLNLDKNQTQQEYDDYLKKYQALETQAKEILSKRDELEPIIQQYQQELQGLYNEESQLVSSYNSKIDQRKDAYTNDPDVKRLDDLIKKYNDGLKSLDKYRENPTYQDFISAYNNLEKANNLKKNIFPDDEEFKSRKEKMQAITDQRNKQLEGKPWERLIDDITSSAVNFYTGAKTPVTGPIGVNLSKAREWAYGLVGDVVSLAASTTDFLLPEVLEIGDRMRWGDWASIYNIDKLKQEEAARTPTKVQGSWTETYVPVESGDIFQKYGINPGTRIVVDENKNIVSFRDEDGYLITPMLSPEARKKLEKDVQTKDTETSISATRGITSTIPSIIDFATMFVGARAMVPGLKKLGLSTPAAGNAAVFGTSFAQMYGDNYSQYILEGLPADKAALYATGKTAATSLVESVIGPLEAKLVTRGAESVALRNYNRLKETTIDLFARGKISRQELLSTNWRGIYTTGKELGLENLEEFGQEGIGNSIDNYAMNTDKSITTNDAVDIFLSTSLISILPSMGAGYAAYKDAKADMFTTSLYHASQNLSKLDQSIDSALKEGVIDVANAAQITNSARYVAEELEMYEGLDIAQSIAISGLSINKKYHEDKASAASNAKAKDFHKKQVELIQEKIDEVAAGKLKPQVSDEIKDLLDNIEEPETEAFAIKEEPAAGEQAPIVLDIKEQPVAAAPAEVKAYDFDGTLFDNKTGKLTPLGEEVKQRIAEGEDITIITARDKENVQEIQDALSITPDKIEATGDEAKKVEALKRRGISPAEYFDADTKKLNAIQGAAAPAATEGLTKEQQADLDKINKRAERIQRTLQEDTEVQEEGDEPLLTAEQKKKLETELQTLNQRKDAIQKQSTTEIPVQPGTKGRQGVGGQVQAKPQGPARESEKAKAEVKAEEEIGDTEFKNFVDNNQVTPQRVESISNKVINNETLSPREQQIFTSRTADINKKIEEIAEAEKKAPQAPKKTQAVPTPTTTEKVSPRAPQTVTEANTIEGFEPTNRKGEKIVGRVFTKEEDGTWKARVRNKNGKLSSGSNVNIPSVVEQLEKELENRTTTSKPPAEVKAVEEKPSTKAAQETKKQISTKDVKLKKGEDFDNDRVYEVTYEGETIGRIYYDRSLHNSWLDADYTRTDAKDIFGDVLGTKEEALQAMVDRWNSKQEETPTEVKKEPTKVEEPAEAEEMFFEQKLPNKTIKRPVEVRDGKWYSTSQEATLEGDIEKQLDEKYPGVREGKVNPTETKTTEGAKGTPTTTEKAPKTILEKLGTSEEAIKAQIKKFFTDNIPGITPEQSQKLADANFIMWKAVANTLNPGKALQFMRRKVAQLGIISTEAQAQEMSTRIGGDLKFQIIGEKGAAALDAAEESSIRLDNLQVAREMESAGKDPKTIRLATGWERGKDGKWRYEEFFEIDYQKDVFLTKVEDMINEYDNYIDNDEDPEDFIIEEVLTLEEIYGTNNNLFKSYPDLKKYTVVLYIDGSTSFNRKSKEITINVLKSKDTTKSLYHELQHAIQSIEGFSGGTSLASLSYKLLDFIDVNKISDDVFSLITKYKNIQKNSDGSLYEMLQYLIGSDIYLRSIGLKLKNEKLKDILTEDGLTYLNKNYNIKDFDELRFRDLYTNSAGEVEARNSAERQINRYSEDFNSEELIRLTEDVSRDEQIVDLAIYGFSDELSTQDKNYIKSVVEDLKSSLNNGDIQLSSDSDPTTLPQIAEAIVNNLINSTKESIEKGYEILSQTKDEKARADIKKMIRGHKDTLNHVLRMRKDTKFSFDLTKISETTQLVIDYIQPIGEEKSLSKIKKLIEDDINKYNEYLKAEKEYNFLEGLIISALGDKVTIDNVPSYVWDTLMDTNIAPGNAEELNNYINKSKEDFKESGELPSNFYFESPIFNVVKFENFVKNNKDYQGLYNDWKSAFDKMNSLDGDYNIDKLPWNVFPKQLDNIKKELDSLKDSDIKFQQEAAKFRGAAIALANGQHIVAALESPMPTTFAHEAIFHATIEEGVFTPEEKQSFIDEYNNAFGDTATDWNTDVSEYTARVYEKYLSNGRKLTEAEVKDEKNRGVLQQAFDTFTELMKELYNAVIEYTNTKGTTKTILLSPQAQAIFDRVTGIISQPTKTLENEGQINQEDVIQDGTKDVTKDGEKAAGRTSQEDVQKRVLNTPVEQAAAGLIADPNSAPFIDEKLAADLLAYASKVQVNIGDIKKNCK